MYLDINLQREIKEIVDDLQDRFKDLSIIDALNAATKIQQNRILADALMVRTPQKTDSPPVALEAIAIGLGFRP